MKKLVHKFIWVWNFDQEEAWLNEMAAKGFCLVSVGFGRYLFEESEPGEYQICMQFLEHSPTHPESEKYIEFLKSTGVEWVDSFARWGYFRKKSADGPFELFSDRKSRVQYLTRVIRFILILIAANLVIGLNNLVTAFHHQSWINFLGFLNLAIAVVGLFGTYRIYKKRKRIEQEGQLFE